MGLITKKHLPLTLQHSQACGLVVTNNGRGVVRTNIVNDNAIDGIQISLDAEPEAPK